ncbi:metalloregulator ArsR/SmtB family transcription factor [Inmirania thermothiophila]|uniref:ArsR family transcriptional regulator n=1 Tax=Inmirania thermothiophila TaxID=1750597 RepID=A0A3N1Y402_9GAMM|nr:metalloregulator ArsR/SmtB family transcription factor [Inmirania thermothiophila]ROR32007.1 ArsR family transcriptional regulator [Inmirania thermothiophila]
MPRTPEELFRALADGTRLRLVLLLAAEGELCVCELTHALDLAQPRISRHLALLRDLGILEARREGQWVFYSVARDLAPWARRIVETTTEVLAGSVLAADRARLQTMPQRPPARRCA